MPSFINRGGGFRRGGTGGNYVTDVDMLAIKEIQDALRKIPVDLEKQVLRMATAKAMTPVSKKAKQNMLRISPTIARALGKKTKVYRGGSAITVVGVKSNTKPTTKREEVTAPDGSVISVKRTHDPIKTIHLVELGTKAHQSRIPWLNLTFMHPGTKAEKPLSKALQSEKSKVVDIFKDNILNGVERIAARRARRGNARR